MAHGLDIDQVFAFHPATEKTGPVHDEVRRVCREAAHELEALTPPSPEQTLALRKLQEAMMHANAAVAIHGVREAEGGAA